MSYRSRTYVRNGQLYGTRGAGLAAVPVLAVKPAVVTVETYLTGLNAHRKTPREVTADEITQEMAKLFFPGRQRNQKTSEKPEKH